MPTLFYVEQCASTNDEILKYITLNENDAVGLYTLHQTKGRGQYGKKWFSGSHGNLAFSLAFPDYFSIPDTLINFCTAIALRHFVAKLSDETVAIKWPNDLIIKHKKVAGILIEKQKINGKSYFIIGIGINILQENFGDITKAGSLFSVSKKTENPKKVAPLLFDFLLANFMEIPSEDDIIREINYYLYKKNEVAVFAINHVRQNGIIQQVDKNGYLYIKLENDGLQKFYHKEIEMLY